MDRADSADERRGAEIVALARAWIGTPYQHQASCKGAGTDCLGLIRGIWRELVGTEPETPPPYTPDWSELGRTEDLMLAAERHLVRLRGVSGRPGDIALMRMAEGSVAKHLGIHAMAPDGSRTLIHAYSGHGVVESPLVACWGRRIVSQYQFPDRRF